MQTIAGQTSTPVITASASDKAVKVKIQQPGSTAAVVEFDYKGKVKTYHVVFEK